MFKSPAISPTQLFAMMILFELGTALVLPIGLVPGSNIWLSILMAMPTGLLMYILIAYFAKQYPAMILSSYLRRIVGVYLGSFIGFCYLVYFLYIAARNLREGGDLLIASSFDLTPIEIIMAAMIVAAIYVNAKGIHVLFRIGEIYILIMLMLGVMSVAAIILSGSVNVRNLLPVMGKGWLSTIKNAYPYISMFPFAELICFSTILPHIQQTNIVRKTGIIAVLFSTVLLSFTHALEVSVIGADVYSRATFPLFTVITTVEVASFLQRLDAFVILALIIGVFFKLTVYVYSATSIAADLFRFPDQRKLAYPMGIIVLLVSLLSAWSYPEHSLEGSTHLVTLYPIFSVAIPMLVLFIHLIKKRFGHAGKAGTTNASR